MVYPPSLNQKQKAEVNYMRLKLLLPKIEPTNYEKPRKCANPKCKGKRFYMRQEVEKNIRDTKYNKVMARRYECNRCHRTMRVYPKGVGRQQISHRLSGIAIMLYVLGLSYGAAEIVMEALGIFIGKTSVYRAVQAAAEKVPGMKQKKLLDNHKTKALGADLTSVRCKGEWLTLGICVDAVNGISLSIDNLSGEDAEHLKQWLEPILNTVDADVLVTDDADAFKNVADEIGLAQQVCKSHVVRNTEKLVEDLSTLIKDGKDTSLQTIGKTSDEALDDLSALDDLIHSRKPEDQPELEQLYDRYAQARKPPKGRFTVAYRMRNLFLDRWNLWPRLSFYRTWKDDYGDLIIDGTNNDCERTIGWAIKERYRTMRGYKRVQSALNVSRLIAFAVNHKSRGLNLADLIA